MHILHPSSQSSMQLQCQQNEGRFSTFTFFAPMSLPSLKFPFNASDKIFEEKKR